MSNQSNNAQCSSAKLNRVERNNSNKQIQYSQVSVYTHNLNSSSVQCWIIPFFKGCCGIVHLKSCSMAADWYQGGEIRAATNDYFYNGLLCRLIIHLIVRPIKCQKKKIHLTVQYPKVSTQISKNSLRI